MEDGSSAKPAVGGPLREKLESEFQQGGLDDLSQHALPFFIKNVRELAQFIEHFERQFGRQDLDMLLKLFILNKNMPFDMGSYMKSQSMFIEQNIRTQCQLTSESESQSRQDAVAAWIRANAHQHRQQAILKQVFCLEKIKESLIPPIEKALAEYHQGKI